MEKILRHLKQTHPALYELACKSLLLDTMTLQITAESSTSDRLLAFSKLVTQAYGLLAWFETEEVSLLFWNWDNVPAQQKSLGLQGTLKQILMENSRPTHPDEDTQMPTPSSDEPSSDQPSATETQGPQSTAAEPESKDVPVKHVKTPRKQRPANRIISAHDPHARVGMKTRFKVIKGYKTQNLCTTSGVILHAKVIPATEPDGEAMYDMVHQIQSFFGIAPKGILGDTLYGYGKQRVELASIGIAVTAPVASPQNPKGLFTNTRFTYNREKDVYVCPNHKESVWKRGNPKQQGSQHHFSKDDCNGCPFRSQCTTSSSGRSVFHSNYYELYEEAKAFNATDKGKELLKQRYLVERKNNEMKNDCGLGTPRTRGQKSLSIKATLVAIVINLKSSVRRLLAPKPGFLRRVTTA
ncbi:transposase [Paenibacillus sp. N3.4]|uniref:transposase n=1 Tax=Paenibacillus sp. N3.4 TaxID=2603222 RepID=UPI0021C44430|nr:transposase [Paenibacillus sp. N3.4]